ANAMTILGAPAEDKQESGVDFLRSVPAEFHEAIRSAVRQARRRNGEGPAAECRAEFRFAMPGGDERWLYASGELQAGTQEHGDRLVGVIADITERRQLEEQLLQSQKMEAVGTLAGGIAHDFNNLLTAILGFAQLSQLQAAALKLEGTTPELREGLEELRTDLDEIVKAGERASLLTGQLLAFSRRQVLRPTRVDVNGVVREVERMLVRLIGERITLETSTATEPLEVLADPGQIAQVIVNLVVNARDALPSGGMVKLRTQRVIVTDVGEPPFAGLSAGTWVVVAVEDNGVGMTQEVIGRMFEPFYTTKRVGEGTGLGLSTVYGIVTQGGGRVFAHSAVGVGTSMHVALPLYAATSDKISRGVAEPPQESRAARVLVVEDEPGLRRLVAEILTRRGYTVEVASDGVDALASLADASQLPDLVLSDVVMPRLGGRALADEIAKRGMSIPVLFMSGYPAGEELPEDEVHTFIGKPFTPEALVRKVRALLERA
ncbi:MAG: ATP-binding protein, partial [Gemmatimonas sp.]